MADGLTGEFSWWLLGDRAPGAARAFLDNGGVLWTPIERRWETVDGVEVPVGFKPRWIEGPDPLWNPRADTKWAVPLNGAE